MDPLIYALALTVCILVVLSLRKKSPIPYPPGPKPLPLIGNVLDLPTQGLWHRATEWANQYGSIVYVNACGQGLVFLNDSTSFMGLLHQRSEIYSDKPRMVMTGELCGAEYMVPFTRYGDRMRRHRRILQKALNSSTVRTYHPMIDSEVQVFLRNIAKTPEDFQAHLLRYTAGLTLLVLYGHQVTTSDDRFMHLAADSMEVLSNKLVTGGGVWLVDVLPFLRYLPTWFPGAGFKQKSIEWRKLIADFVNEPYEACKAQINAGTAKPSFCSIALEKEDASPSSESDLKWTVNSMYTASIDTTGSAISNFFLAMTLHPEVMTKAQQEIDTVIGNQRLPTLDDRASLPYIEAMLSECLRYACPAPLNLPHMLMEDDTYEGMFIPKGTWIIGNIWAISRNETTYPDPHAFRPERFLAKVDEETRKRMDPRSYVFGAGRRRCPGIPLIQDGMWLMIARIVATLDIKKKVVNGVPVEPQVTYDNAFLRIPSNFECDIRPREGVNLL